MHYFKVFIKGKPFQSVADSIYLAHKSSNETDVRVGIVSTLAAFFSASGGASIGQYGPLVHFGTTLGAWLKQKMPFNFTPDLYIGASVAASISSGFGAFGRLDICLEAILRHYSHKSILAIATASGISYAVSAIWGDANVIAVSPDQFNLLLILLISFLAGPIFGLIAILYMKSLLFFNKLANQNNFNLIYKYGVCIISLSIIGHFVPELWVRSRNCWWSSRVKLYNIPSRNNRTGQDFGHVNIPKLGFLVVSSQQFWWGPELELLFLQYWFRLESLKNSSKL